jgi:two-component system NtrC family sensor kinase
LQDDPKLELFIGPAVISRSVAKSFVPLARRINDADGRFLGVAVAAIDPQFLESLYGRLSLGAEDSIALLHSDSTLIARIPALPDLIGRRWQQSPLFSERLTQSRRGAFRTRNLAGANVVVGYSTLDDFPVVVTATIGLEGALFGWWLSSMALLAVAVGAVFLLIWLFAEIERRKMERAMLRRRKLLAYKLEEMGQMTGTIAHDFNNVLTAVASGVQLMRKKGSSDDLLSGVEQAIERGSRLTSQLLAFAKRRDFSLTEADPSELLRSLELVLRHAAGPNVTVTLDLSHEVLHCVIDRAQFDAAIINLAINAAQAMPDGGRLTISTGSRSVEKGGPLRPGLYAVIRVTDTGSGIAPEHMDKLFKPFFTTKRETGTGLGLAQVREFVVQLGGDVTIRSVLQAGTTVEMLIPCLPRAGDSPSLGELPPNEYGSQMPDADGPAEQSHH